MRLTAPILAAALLVATHLGCARTAEERQLDSLRADIEDMQRERDRLDLPRMAADPSEPQVEPTKPTGPAPELLPRREAIRVEPSPAVEEDDYADPEDTSPRPKIRVLGSPRTRARGRRGGDEAEQVVTDEGAGGGTSLDPDAKRAYDAALSLVNSRQFGAAMDALTAFLVKWPDHPYADHAMYWRGECYFAQGDFVHATEQFEGVLARFPAGMKAADALLKLAMCHQKLGHAAQARVLLDRLVQDYPQSDAAHHAPAPPVEDRR